MALLTFPLPCFVGLAVGANEVTVAGYVRQPALLEYTANAANIGNLASLQWQHATQSWGVIDTAQFWDAVSGGNLLGVVSVATPLLIAQYDIARIPASGIDVTYNKINRPFGTHGFGTFTFGTSYVFSGTQIGARPYGSGPYGSGVYGGIATGVLLERAFDQQTHVCEPGTWAPGPFALAA